MSSTGSSTQNCNEYPAQNLREVKAKSHQGKKDRVFEALVQQ